MIVERKVVKSFRGEATIVFLMVAIPTYALTSSIVPIVMIFVGFFITLLLLRPKNIIYILQLDEIGFCFKVNQQVKYQYSWREIEIVTIEAEYRGWQHEVTVFITNGSIGKTLPIHLSNQEVSTLRIHAAKWPESKIKIKGWL
jgi:hypothetical protein